MKTRSMMYTRRGFGLAAILAVIVLLATGCRAERAVPSSATEPGATDNGGLTQPDSSGTPRQVAPQPAPPVGPPEGIHPDAGAHPDAKVFPERGTERLSSRGMWRGPTAG